MEFLRGIAQAFYQPLFYRGLAAEGRGIGLRYCLFLAAVQILLLSAQAGGMAAWRDFRQNSAALSEKVRALPTIAIKGGELSIDAPTPYVIPVLKDEKIVIDPSVSKADSLDSVQKKMALGHIILLIGKDTGFAVKDADRLETFNYKEDAEDVTLSPEIWGKLADLAKDWGFMIFVFVGVFMLAAFFFYNMLAAFCSAVVGLIVAAFLRAPLSFDAATRLASAARVPASLIGLLLIKGNAGLSWGIWGVYLIFAVWSVKVSANNAPAKG